MVTRATCLEEPDADHKVHAWQRTGLDVVGGVLCNTRRCVWCQREEHKTYGAKRGAWRQTKEATW